jgi:hypothetical protein
LLLKGSSGAPDIPYLCEKRGDDTYEWIPMPVQGLEGG